MAMNYSDYPANWEDIRAEVLERAKNADGIPQCECLGECEREHKGTRCPHLQCERLTTRSKYKVILTTAHLCHTPKCDRLDHLKSMCQPCHQIFDLRERQKRDGGKTYALKSRAVQLSERAKRGGSSPKKKQVQPKVTSQPDGEGKHYLQKKSRELSAFETQQIRDRIEHGDGDVYKLAKEFGCVPVQIAGIKARLKF
jgi:hypothetical protein